MTITITQTDFSDFEALRDVVQDNQSEVMQLGAGRMIGSITHLALDPTFGISTGSFSQSVRATGILSNNRWSLGMMLATDGPALGHHHKFVAGELVIAGPGVDRYIRFQGGTEYVATMIDPQELQAFLVPQPGAFDFLLSHSHTVLSASPIEALTNIKHLKPLVSALIEDGQQMPPGTLAFYKRNIMELLTMSVSAAIQHRSSHQLSQDTLIRDIDRYLMETGPRPIHISELCEHFRVQRRTLHRAFEVVLGIPPISYLRKRRLNDVHSALRRNAPGVSVAGVARDHGFLELGRFAAAYRRQFGEKPSQTLRRSQHIPTSPSS